MALQLMATDTIPRHIDFVSLATELNKHKIQWGGGNYECLLVPVAMLRGTFDGNDNIPGSLDGNHAAGLRVRTVTSSAVQALVRSYASSAYTANSVMPYVWSGRRWMVCVTTTSARRMGTFSSKLPT